MECLASMFASHIRSGDCYCLYGAVGAGKSVFSRAFIRTVMDDETLPVPSPTFLLQNTYDEHQGPPLHHFDFYRLTKPEEFYRLNLQDSYSQAVCLMEWPERLQAMPKQYLAIRIQVIDSTQTEQQQAAAGGEAGSGSWGASFSSADEYLGDEDDSEARFTDRRPRLVAVQPHGSYWEDKAQRVLAYIAAHEPDCEGLRVLARGEAERLAAGSGGGQGGGGSSS